MKKNSLIITILFVMISNSVYAQKRSKNILKSTNIAEIEAYLKNCHPEDPKKLVLKPKLIALKNEEWTKGKKGAKPMEARPVITDISNSTMRNLKDAEEFKRLITENSGEHKDKTIKLLNAMFNEDITSKEVILLCKNRSDCNLILRIQGKKYYNLAIPAHSENFIVIEKGNYTLNSNVCDVQYSSQKEIKKGVYITLNNPSQVGNKAISNNK
ncbi:DUF6759 domain-containing protein [Chryseobacterium sp. G0201]|uniref:DUF6759 domain-containing protein n=1 Tax=Chryseobacterium sp. G0201 TaxID=2487065 RepID=UPI000F4EC246|nr:DUF6759 domain-containing protein [Chryseobacterium sp. G0201]AZA52327.1 hypothetical protein EG348_04565 [Chryseobacterium sp. G0201]